MMYRNFHQYSLKSKWSVHTPIFFQSLQVKNHHFENDNDIYDETQKYTVKPHDFFAPMVEESLMFSRDFNVKTKTMTKIFSQNFHVFFVKAAIFNFLEEIFQFWAQILKEHTRE